MRKEGRFAKYYKQTLPLCFYIVHDYKKAFFLSKSLIFEFIVIVAGWVIFWFVVRTLSWFTEQDDQ